MHRPEPSGFRQGPPLRIFRPQNVDEWLEHNASDAQAIAAGEFNTRFLWCRPPSRQQLLDSLPYLGTRTARERWWNDISGTEDERGRRLADDLNAFIRAANPSPKSREDHLREDFEALDAEQADVRTRIPEELRIYLDRMHPARRREREAAIREYVGLEDLSLIGLEPGAIAVSASTRAKRYFREFPPRDENGAPIHQEPFHRKRRCEKWWRRHLRKRQRRALLYVEAAVGAVGGANLPGRPLYVSDYTLESYKTQLRITAELLEELRLVCVDDPSIQIPMKELNQRKKLADASKRRTLMDATLARIEGLGWYLIWITITLPGRYVPHSTNESHRWEAWDPELGPDEASREIQNRHHQTMCLLREREIRPFGWWNAQAQQSGTPHRHLLLACPTLEDARGVCDAFRDKFSSARSEDLGNDTVKSDPGCAAFVVGDDDPIYAPPRSKDGRVETASSIAKYMSRYATRFVNPDCDAEEDTDLLRHAAWASARRARTHSWVGMDAGRSPSALWDTLWSRASRSDEQEDPESPRLKLALRMMREVQECTDAIAELRRHQETLEGEDLDHQRDLIKAESSNAAHRAWHAGIALGLWPDRDLAPQELDWLRNEIEELDPERRHQVQSSGIHLLKAHGMNSTTERLETDLPPMPLRDIRESAYGERRAVTIGISAPVPRFLLTREQFRDAVSLRRITQLLGLNLDRSDTDGHGERAALIKGLRQAGIQFSRRPDGTVVGFDLTGETILRTDREWIITDADTAEEMFENWKERLSSDAPRLDNLSDNPTDPSMSPPGSTGAGQSGEPPPS